MEQKSSAADRVSKRLPDAYSCQPGREGGGIATDRAQKT